MQNFRKIGLAFSMIVSMIGNLISSAVFAQTEVASKNISCEVEFEFDSVAFDETILEKCFVGVEDHKLDFFYIYASATFQGSQEYNQALTERRSAALQNKLQAMYPGVRFEVLPGGENVKGKSARVTAILLDERPVKNLKSELSDTRSEVQRWRKFRLTIRAGAADYKHTDTKYELVGTEFSRIYPWTAGVTYLEFGGGANYMTDDDVLDLYTLDLIAGGYYVKGLFQTGIRAKLGRLARTDNKESTTHIGAEVRAGLEGERFSGFLSYGVFKDVKIVSLDLGVRL